MNKLSLSTEINNKPSVLSTSVEIYDSKEVRYNFHDYIAPFQPERQEVFKSPPKEGLLIYRSLITWFPCEDDHTPLRLRKRAGKQIKAAFTYDQVLAMNDEKRIRELMHLALSCNASEEDAIRSLDYKLKSLKDKGLPKDEIDSMMSERGLYIAPFLMTPKHGIITDFNNGHGNIILYEGVTFTDMIIPGKVPLNYKYEL